MVVPIKSTYYDRRLIFPVFPRCCNTRDKKKCNAEAPLVLASSRQGHNLIMYVCRKCGLEIVNEYREKLNERYWYLIKLHKE